MFPEYVIPFLLRGPTGTEIHARVQEEDSVDQSIWLVTPNPVSRR